MHGKDVITQEMGVMEVLLLCVALLGAWQGQGDEAQTRQRAGREEVGRDTKTYTWWDLRHGREAGKGVCFHRLAGVGGLDGEGGLNAHHHHAGGGLSILVLVVVLSGSGGYRRRVGG